MTITPSFLLESQYAFPVAGVDEAGCGPWAGPVVASAVIFFREKVPEKLFHLIRDSKKLSKRKREDVFKQLIMGRDDFLLYGIGNASVEEIDQSNIGQANRLAMQRALQNLPLTPHTALVDGIRNPGFQIPTQLVVKGDQLSYSIAAASIIAKVERDKIMDQLDQDYPQYGWAKNAGYGTAQHITALQKYGITPHHRQSFAPIRALKDTMEQNLRQAVNPHSQ
jgi:ribonuclease HII